MIELHVPVQRTTADIELEEHLKELVVAHRVEVHQSEGTPVPLPAILEGGKWTPGSEFGPYLSDLRSTLREWRKFQADACYVDDDGGIC